MNRIRLMALALLPLAAACGGETDTAEVDTTLDTAAVAPAPAADPQASGPAARAELMDAQGQSVGTAELTQSPQGLVIAVNLRGLAPGEHGIHVHETGQCEAPGFTSAGAHANPEGRQHGFDNPQGPHLGDLRNLTVGQDSTVQQQLTNEGANLDTLLDADGAALVVHASADDYRTDPSGNSGDRIACGVITR